MSGPQNSFLYLRSSFQRGFKYSLKTWGIQLCGVFYIRNVVAVLRKQFDYLPNVREVSPSNWVGISDRPGYGLSKYKWLGGSPSTRKRPGGGLAQGPYVARVMTGGGFNHLLVEKVTYWYLCLISTISGLCQNSFPFQNSLDVTNSVHTLHNRGSRKCLRDIHVDIYRD